MTDAVVWSLASQQSKLAANEIHIWRANLDLAPNSVARLSAFLSGAEISRAARFFRPSDRQRFVVARGVLRELLGGYVHKPPATLVIDTGVRGKPALHDGAGTSALRFNLSHSHGLALYAFVLHRELGVDVEWIRPEVAREALEERYFSSEELLELRTLPQESHSEAFFLCWTRKEAYIKARGEGLSIPLDTFSVSLTPGQPACLSSDDYERWSIHSISPQPGFAGALVVEGSESSLRFWEWRESNG